jgi:hypothetical protein
MHVKWSMTTRVPLCKLRPSSIKRQGGRERKLSTDVVDAQPRVGGSWVRPMDGVTKAITPSIVNARGGEPILHWRKTSLKIVKIGDVSVFARQVIGLLGEGGGKGRRDFANLLMTNPMMRMRV